MDIWEIIRRENIFFAVTPEEGRRLENSIDVSTLGDPPYNLFSPYTYSADFRIPVPGEPEQAFAHSVEGIWQGLKVINGQTDPKRFRSKPKKRSGFVEGHELAGELLDCHQAREQIYYPSYSYYLDHYLPKRYL